MIRVRTFKSGPLLLSILASLVVLFTMLPPAIAAPPVRIAVVPGGGSGIEQDVVDRITGMLEGSADIVVSTVNPDWYCVCNIQEHNDQVSGQIRYNGTVTVKTVDGTVISTVSAQKYNQDFSMSAGAPLNKRLVDAAAQDVIATISQRAVGPIQQAVQVEIETRELIIKAELLADEDKYDEAIASLRPVSPDTPHFKGVRQLIAEYEMEKQAIALCEAARQRAAQGRYSEAIKLLTTVDPKSKRTKLAKSRIATYRAKLAGLPRTNRAR